MRTKKGSLLNTYLFTISAIFTFVLIVSVSFVSADSQDPPGAVTGGCGGSSMDSDCDGHERRPGGPIRPGENLMQYDYDDNDANVGSCGQVCG